MMATGGRGHSKPRTSASESRQRSSWQRSTSASDKEDNLSIHSIPNDLRPNNWDFSDWRPSAHFDQTKRRKKGNPEWEREQSLTQDSPPSSERQHGTPRTYPRTKITPNTPTSQRVALENLKQHMTFSDLEDQLSTDGEKNNERNVVIKRENPPNYTRQDTSSPGDRQPQIMANGQVNRRNRNNNREENLRDGAPDSNQIVARLMQVRDYIKQATSLMDSLQKSGDRPGPRDEVERLQSLIEHLKEQEKGYTTLLQRVLSFRDEVPHRVAVNGINSRDPTPNMESVDDTQSLDLDVRSETSEPASERSPRVSPRPRIEDKLGLDSGDDNEEEENKAESESSEESETMDDTVVSGRRQPEWDFELSESEMDAAGGVQRAEALDHLVALRQQQELLKKLIEQQEQMRALKGRQAALLALQQDAEKKLAEARGRANQAHSEVLACEEGSQSLVMSRGSGRNERENNAPGLIEGATGELSALRQRLLTLRNELKQTSNGDAQEERPTNNQQGFQLPPSALQMSREQLKNKLQELQEKKQHMDEMLEELQVMRMDRVDDFLAATRGASTTSGSSTSAPNSAAAAAGLNRHDLYDGEAAIARAEETESMAKETLELLGAREKISKLNEVRQRLNQLKSLMSYYQSADSGTAGPQEDEEQSSLPGYSDYGEGEAGQRDRGSLRMPAERDIPTAQGSGGGAKMDNQSRLSLQPQHDDNSSQSSSDTESQLSSLGPWGDDPEIQEKVRKLKAAKEKLKRLQSLVAMVQQTPEVVGDLPDNIAEIAASLEEVESQLTQADDRNNASVSEGEVQLNTQQPLNLQAAERNKFYENKMREQLQELQQLKEEKERLLSIQQQLQKLHGRFQTVNQTEDETDAAAPKPSSTSQNPPSEPQVQQAQQQSGPSVKFSSNEEVYDKMRKQRMLREELRDKKKQLESIMKKDRNKRSYYKNQDNQSDSVSYSTDAYGASASIDATMATWGGSTVDALESITEDGAVDHQDNEGDEGVDDAYPSDGIVQVEEEEEENDSDNETYTIEEDVRQRRRARASQQQASKQTKNKNRRSFPRASDQNQGGARPKERNTWNPKQQPSFSRWSRSNKNKGHSKQENYRSAEEIVVEDEQNGGPVAPNSMEVLQQQLEQTARMCQTILGNSPSTTGSYNQPRGPSGVTQDFQQLMQQQQMIITMNQCYQQMALQQMEIQNLQRQFQGLLSQMPDMGDIENQNESCLSRESRLRSLTSLQSPGMNRFSPLLLQPNLNFQPQLSEGLLSSGYRRSTDNLYPGSNTEVNMFGTDRSRNQRQMPVRSEQNDQNAELSFQKSKRKSSKSQKESPGQQGISSLPPRYNNVGSQTILPMETQSREQEETEVPRLNIEQIEKRRRELLQSAGLRSLFVTEPGNRGQERSNKTKSAPLRPGLSGGISGAGYMESMSVTSSILSSQIAGAQGDQEQQGYEGASRESDDPNELSLFEALRETIYSEVATLISQNENRPHYLIELFRELQRLSTDYLRQRALYDIKDLVSKYLVDEGTDSVTAPPPPWLNPNCNNFTVSELTPSESMVTSDEEEVRAKLREKVSAVEKRKLSKLPRSNSMKSDQYDYQEEAEITSSISTPSTAYWESPFAHESLGETVINLDKTLKKMREYEKRMAEQESEAKAERDMAGGSNNGRVERSNEACSSSAMDQGSESSATSDVPYPRINTQLLDRHIKTIMKEVMPVIKEHMDNTCSPQLLAYIKNLALSLTRQYDSGQEFSKFFHRQLGTVLQDSLAKFEGKKMRECGEDLVVDISEVLFNELAFFRLMQDLDDPMVVDKIKAGSWPEFSDRKRNDDQSEESDTTESSTAQASDNEQEEASLKASPREMEDLGKARDDEMASQVQIQELEDKDEELDMKYDAVQIELSISETKPFTRIGSDEDDEDEDADESQSNEDPSETAVSRDYRLEDASWEENEEEIINGDDNSAFMVPSHPSGVVSAEGDQNDADQGAENSEADPNMANGASHFNGDLLNGDIEVITMDELPLALQVMSKEDLQARIMEEQESTSGTAGILASMEVETELAGDGEFLKEPDGASG